jgi:aryl-alcohol dehydrogenase-like predicted oxidoreductase
MERRNLGNSGLSVSAVGLGCNNIGRTLDLEASRRVIHAALDHGISFFDTGDVYGRRGGSETIIGKVLGPRRKDVVIATKFGRPMDTEGKSCPTEDGLDRSLSVAQVRPGYADR